LPKVQPHYHKNIRTTECYAPLIATLGVFIAILPSFFYLERFLVKRPRKRPWTNIMYALISIDKRFHYVISQYC